MKKCLILIAWVTLLSACTQETSLSITPDIASFQFDADGGSFDAVIFTNGSWVASCEDEAVLVSPSSGDYTSPIHIVVGPNEEHHTKSIRISLLSKLDDKSRSNKIVITQACRPFIFSEETQLQVLAAGGDVRFHVNANESWKVTETRCNGEIFALQVDPSVHGPNSTEVTVVIPENRQPHRRVFTVTLALEDYPEKSLVLTVVQANNFII